jgi:hypothetical protein
MPTNLPHYNVCTRLKISPLHGLGVFAILPIKKRQPIFYGDDAEMAWVDEHELVGIPDNMKELYEDFCVKKGNLYGCPANFNQLTISWYLNNFDNPNIYCDKNFNFFALRDIDVGEELTADYSTYSDDYRK